MAPSFSSLFLLSLSLSSVSLFLCFSLAASLFLTHSRTHSNIFLLRIPSYYIDIFSINICIICTLEVFPLLQSTNVRVPPAAAASSTTKQSSAVVNDLLDFSSPASPSNQANGDHSLTGDLASLSLTSGQVFVVIDTLVSFHFLVNAVVAYFFASRL